MSDIAIRVENLGKQYHIGALLKNGGRYSYKSLRDSIAGAASLPFRAARSLIGGNGSSNAQKDETIWALKDVSFEVKHGEIVGVIGRNGAGKSTLLKLLSRITEPTTGRVEIHGRVGSLLEVGTGFHPELTGRDNVFLNGAILGMKRAEIAKNFDAIVAFAEVEKFIDTPVKHYSSGMYLRLAFAVAAYLQTEILIVDEVLAVGDAAFQKKCLGKMKEVSGSGRTVFFVSHNLEAVNKLCNRGILLERGTVLHIGSAKETIQSYVDRGSAQSSEFAITPPSDKGAPAQATCMAIEDINGNPTHAFEVGDPWQVRVSFEVLRRTERFVAGIGLVSERGVPIWTGWSEPMDMDPGCYEAIFRNELLSLSMGSFPITVGLSADNRNIHYTEEVGTLSIVSPGERINAIKVNGDCGFVVNPMPSTVLRTEARVYPKEPK